MPSAALTAGSAGGVIDRPRVSGFFGASARRIWSEVTSSAAAAMPAVSDRATLIMAIVRSALKPGRADVFGMGASFI